MHIESKSRMISFRITEEEYVKFRELCLTYGIRSVSEMARTAIQLLEQQPDRAPQKALESRVAELEGRSHLLALEVKKLNHNLGLSQAESGSRRVSEILPE